MGILCYNYVEFCGKYFCSGENDEKMDDLNRVEKEYYMAAYEKLRLHFVYNAMNAIKYYIPKEPETASLMIGDLADFLRGSVENALGEKMIPLKEELRFAHSYAELESLRSRKLQLEWEAENEEGEVLSGSIYRGIEKMLRKHVFTASFPRTLRVWEAGEDAVCIEIVEKEEKVLIPVNRY